MKQLPKVIVRSRSVVYEYGSIGRDVDLWFRNIWQGGVIPKYRKSVEPKECHAQFVDMTGDTLWSWLKQYDLLLYTYGQNSVECEAIFEPLYGHNNSVVLARMNLDQNDHEIFPNVAKKDYVYLFQNMTLTRVLNCKEKIDITSLLQ